MSALAGLVVRSRLFWQVYVTLLASLMLAALAIAAVGQLSGSHTERSWPLFQTRFVQSMMPADDTQPGEIDRAVARLAGGLSSRVEVVAPSRRCRLCSGSGGANFVVMLQAREDSAAIADAA